MEPSGDKKEEQTELSRIKVKMETAANLERGKKGGNSGPSWVEIYEGIRTP